MPYDNTSLISTWMVVNLRNQLMDHYLKRRQPGDMKQALRVVDGLLLLVKSNITVEEILGELECM